MPVDGCESPWRLAQIVFVYDSARIKAADVPRSAAELLEWSRKHPGRLTHPKVRNFLGSTFLKQALYELAPDPAVLQRPATDDNFAATAAPLWAWYDELRPTLWRKGMQFPENGSAQRQLLNDGEIDIMLSFNPAEAAVSVAGGQLPASVRTFTCARARSATPASSRSRTTPPTRKARWWWRTFCSSRPRRRARRTSSRWATSTCSTWRDCRRPIAQLFDKLTPSDALPTPAELGKPLLEPHASWMTRIAAEWQRRYTQ